MLVGIVYLLTILQKYGGKHNKSSYLHREYSLNQYRGKFRIYFRYFLELCVFVKTLWCSRSVLPVLPTFLSLILWFRKCYHICPPLILTLSREVLSWQFRDGQKYLRHIFWPYLLNRSLDLYDFETYVHKIVLDHQPNFHKDPCKDARAQGKNACTCNALERFRYE